MSTAIAKRFDRYLLWGAVACPSLSVKYVGDAAAGDHSKQHRHDKEDQDPIEIDWSLRKVSIAIRDAAYSIDKLTSPAMKKLPLNGPRISLKY